MHQKILAWQDELTIIPSEQQLKTESYLLTMVYSLSRQLSMEPVIYTTEDSIWIYYERSCFVCDTLLDEYGISVATVSRKYPLSLCGSALSRETAELKAFFDQEHQRIIFQKWNISGKDFDQLANLCLRLIIADTQIKAELTAILQNISYKNHFIAIKRTDFAEKTFAYLPQLSPDTYYRFIPLPDLGVASCYLTALTNDNLISIPDINELECYSPYLDKYRFIPIPEEGDIISSILDLSVAQQKELWLVFLADRISPLEFFYVLQAVDKGQVPSFFTWELSLRLAIDEEGIRILYDDNGFTVKDRNGQRIIYDYTAGSAAEKLLLKIIFPIAKRLN